MNAVKEKAFAKINLFLDVVSRREDGFHDIESVMHTVTLFDEVTVSVNPSKNQTVRLVLENDDAKVQHVPIDEKNLAVKAAYAFLRKTGLNYDVHIRLKKNIPVAAGLGGGSADAAAVLRALNKIFKRYFTENALCELGAEIGSDVPFCICGKTAICKGRGEKIQPIISKLSLNLVIANSGEYVSTPHAYGMLDERYSNFSGEVSSDGKEYFSRFLNSLSEERNIIDGMYNIFEETVLEKCPLATELKSMLEFCGAKKAMMSGSGPSVFGVFEKIEDANRVARTIKEAGFIAYSVASAE